MQSFNLRLLAALLTFFVAMPPNLPAQQGPIFNQEELEQILAPIALYPDSLVSQMLMASTYPLEVVQADRFVKEHTHLQGDDLTAALEAQQWDPSVKSLVNFPQVLTMMSEKLDWTQKLGDAFLAQQEEVMDTIQRLRFRAQEAGNLNTTKEQKVVVQEKVIVIEPANPQVVYVPTYNPTVVYGAWPYPAYPPYYYYPPGYVASTAFFSFATGVALGAAWGYAWGGCNWHSHKVTYNYNQNININRNINRDRYVTNLPAGGRGDWRHNPQHRRGVAYRDQRVAQRYNRGTNSQAVQAREAFRGRAEQGRQEIARGGATQARDRQAVGAGKQAATARERAGGVDRSRQPRASQRIAGADRGGQAQTRERVAGASGSGQVGTRNRAAASKPGGGDAGARPRVAHRGDAFAGVNRGGNVTRNFSERGRSSRGTSAPAGGGARGLRR